MEESQSDDGNDHLQSVDEDDLFTVYMYVGIEKADPLCAKIHDLIQKGKISKDRIFYKYLRDVVEIMYNPFHEYDREVVEFFNTITYLGGKRTASFIRGPINLGDGRNSHVEKKINLGGLSESVCAKHQAGYTPDSGVIKPLSLGHLELLKNSQAKQLIETSQLTVIPCALAHDGTSLKPAIEFDSRLKENVGLKTSVDINYVKYDREVVEFFNTITYLGGKRTASFIRGPMNLGDGRNSHVEKKMNLGGPSESVCAKHQAGYTPDSGVIKPLSLGHLELLKNSQAKRLIETSQLTVIPCALAHDGTALKPAIEFDSQLKENVGLKMSVDINYVKENSSPSPEYLKENIITEAIVSSLTSLDNQYSLPVGVDYATQSGKTGQAMIDLFAQHIKPLQACESCQKKAQHRRDIITPERINCVSFCEVCYESKTVCGE